MLVHFMLFPRSLRLSSILFILFSLFCSAVFISTTLSSRSLIRSSASVILLLIPSREVLFYFFMLFIIVCLPFSSSRSLLNISCVFSILFPRFWIIFTIITLNFFQVYCLFPPHLFGLLGFYLAPSSAVCLSVFSFCLTYCDWGLIFASCRFIVLGFLVSAPSG